MYRFRLVLLPALFGEKEDEEFDDNEVDEDDDVSSSDGSTFFLPTLLVESLVIRSLSGTTSCFLLLVLVLLLTFLVSVLLPPVLLLLLLLVLVLVVFLVESLMITSFLSGSRGFSKVARVCAFSGVGLGVLGLGAPYEIPNPEKPPYLGGCFFVLSSSLDVVKRLLTLLVGDEGVDGEGGGTGDAVAGGCLLGVVAVVEELLEDESLLAVTLLDCSLNLCSLSLALCSLSFARCSLSFFSFSSSCSRSRCLSLILSRQSIPPPGLLPAGSSFFILLSSTAFDVDVSLSLVSLLSFVGSGLAWGVDLVDCSGLLVKVSGVGERWSGLGLVMGDLGEE